MRVPKSTYRLQITKDFPLAAAASLVPYMKELGVDWVYLSPLLAAEPGSDHGYDVIDHGRIDPDRGGAEGLAEVAGAAHEAGLGVLVDIVPNHVGIATPKHSAWWWDVLKQGQDSVYASAFDIDWEAGDGRIAVPVLGSADDLEALRIDGDELVYYEHRFPIADGTPDGTPREVHDAQHYRLVDWRIGDRVLNYRRFFAVSTLAAVRVEDPDVFDASHREVARWFSQGQVDGLRIDHPDGLADPAGYLDWLRRLTNGAYVVVEKILEPGESLPSGWACEGTTGYDALAVLDRLFVDPAGEAVLNALDTELRSGLTVSWPDMIASTKRDVADGILRAEVERLARLLPEIPDAADALAEILASFPVYRSYLPQGLDHLRQATEAARRRRPLLAATIDQVARRLADPDDAAARRFQQTSGMAMAKGVEDCAFYRWSRLTSLTEVGADPARFALSPSGFHAVQSERLVGHPRSMTALTTHDTKRGEDTRARISALSELADEWAETVRTLNRKHALGDGPMAHLLWQAAVGAWPLDRERLSAYSEKAAREAGVSTSWTEPDDDFEKRLGALVDAVYDDPETRGVLDDWSDRVSRPGWSNSLSAKVLQLAGPGVPDVYQGSEVRQDSLVDPDNRRPVDFAALQERLRDLDAGGAPPLDGTGAAKLWVTSRVLRLRRDRPELFTQYTPLFAEGAAADHAVAFDRGGAIAVATRLSNGLRQKGGWSTTTLELPVGGWRDAFTDREFAGRISVAELLADYPVALLVKEEQ